ncbi:hypothetical protein QVZ41_13900 [Wenyingzhuangia sp. chi5]|uniref:Lipoprotein n=1 Tax=Wenyingzhuangia gilva TaxID=3057677 RepID=A0ABT8VVF3_9FLAO|nr:hypothetical protein [Wenyingzhuangia sp. chi5]MDO3695940.1 hypothetical protein [Wenyingzhuangia sp. chi5]
MKKISLVIISLSLLSCNENNLINIEEEINENDTIQNVNNFEVQVSSVNDTIFIDKPTNFKITSEKLFNSCKIIYSETNSRTLSFEPTTEYIFCETINKKHDTLNIIVNKSDSINPGFNQNKYYFESFNNNGVKINSIEFISFENQQTLFENDEFNNNEKFKYFQYYINKFIEECRTPYSKIEQWYFSKPLIRGNNYYWDLNNENIIINNPTLIFEITPYYVDNDKNIIYNPKIDPNNLLETSYIDPFYRDNNDSNSIEIRLNNYRTEKSKIVYFERADLKLKIKLELEW